MKAIHLPRLGVLRLSGADRLDFLQGQLTQDVMAAGASRSLLWGWNNPKGRLLALGQLMNQAETTLLVLPQALLEQTMNRLRMFVLRAQVSIEATGLAVGGLPTDQAAAEMPELSLIADDHACGHANDRSLMRLAGDPSRALVLTQETELIEDPAGVSAWELADIRAGLPDLWIATAEAFVPQMVNLDILGGISFNKGCYVGQEVVARTQNLGRIKRRMLRFACPTSADPGGVLTDPQGSSVGKVVRSAPADNGHELLAVVQLAAADGPLALAGQALEPLPLPYPLPD